jgi:hypothetical protein
MGLDNVETEKIHKLLFCKVTVPHTAEQNYMN